MVYVFGHVNANVCVSLIGNAHYLNNGSEFDSQQIKWIYQLARNCVKNTTRSYCILVKEFFFTDILKEKEEILFAFCKFVYFTIAFI